MARQLDARLARLEGAQGGPRRIVVVWQRLHEPEVFTYPGQDGPAYDEEGAIAAAYADAGPNAYVLKVIYGERPTGQRR